MKKLIYILFILLLTACRDDLNSPLAEDKGTPMKFEAVVIDAPQSRGQVLDVTTMILLAISNPATPSDFSFLTAATTL